MSMGTPPPDSTEQRDQPARKCKKYHSGQYQLPKYVNYGLQKNPNYHKREILRGGEVWNHYPIFPPDVITQCVQKIQEKRLVSRTARDWIKAAFAAKCNVAHSKIAFGRVSAKTIKAVWKNLVGQLIAVSLIYRSHIPNSLCITTLSVKRSIVASNADEENVEFRQWNMQTLPEFSGILWVLHEKLHEEWEDIPLSIQKDLTLMTRFENRKLVSILLLQIVTILLYD